MAERTIAHSLFFHEVSGVQKIAMRGDRVELSAAEVKRGEELGAFEAEPAPEDRKAAEAFAAAQKKAADAAAKEQEANAKAEAKLAEEAEKAAALSKAGGAS